MHKHPEQAFKILETFRAEKLPPDLNTYHSILYLMAENELAEEALAILSDMEAVGVQGDLLAYNLVLQVRYSSLLKIHGAYVMTQDRTIRLQHPALQSMRAC